MDSSTFQASSLLLLAMVADHILSRYLATSNSESRPSPPRHSTAVVQTAIWRYSKSPDALLFDFSGLGVGRERRTALIKAVLPSKMLVSIRSVGPSLTQVSLVEQDNELAFARKQAYSILKNRGLYIKSRHVWLKPTPTLISARDHIFWRIRLLEFPRSYAQAFIKDRIADTLCAAFQKQNSSNMDNAGARSNTLVIAKENVLFNEATPSNYCSVIVTVLLQEHVVTTANIRSNKKHQSINPIRRLVYIPFLKRHLPIEISMIT